MVIVPVNLWFTVNIGSQIISNTTISRPEPVSKHPLAAEAGGLSGKPLFDMSTTVLKEMYMLTRVIHWNLILNFCEIIRIYAYVDNWYSFYCAFLSKLCFSIWISFLAILFWLKFNFSPCTLAFYRVKSFLLVVVVLAGIWML